MADKLARQLLAAIDHMVDLAPGFSVQSKGVPETKGRTPWKLAARFVAPAGTTYDDVFQVLRDWRDDRAISREIDKNRLTRIQVRYRNKKGRGSHGEYTLAEIGAWQLTSSRAVERVGIRDDRLESLIARYGMGGESGVSYIDSLIVWFSSMSASEIRLGTVGKKPKEPKPKAKKSAKPKKAKAAKKKVNTRRRRI